MLKRKRSIATLLKVLDERMTEIEQLNKELATKKERIERLESELAVHKVLLGQYRRDAINGNRTFVKCKEPDEYLFTRFVKG